MWILSVPFLCLLLLPQSLANVINGVEMISSCTGSLSISHYDTKEVLHTINKTVTSANIIISRNTRVVVQQTGNCCHRVFNKRNCRGESLRVWNNEGREVKGHRGSLSVIRFDSNDFEESNCRNVSDRELRKICKAAGEDAEEQARLTIGDEDVKMIQGKVYNVTVGKNGTVIIIQNQKVDSGSSERMQSFLILVFSFLFVINLN